MSNQAYKNFSPIWNTICSHLLGETSFYVKELNFKAMKKPILLFIVLVLTVFVSCQKFETAVDENIDNEITDPQVKTMTDMVVSDDFSWKTTTDLNIVLKASTRGVVFINSTNNSTYQKGMLFEGEDFTTKITIPTYVDKLELVFDGKSYEVAIENNKIEYDFK